MRRSIIKLILICLIIIPTLRLSAQDNTYIVQPGDTLFRIAVRFNTTVAALAAANGLADPTRIYAGQVLVIVGSSGDSGGGAPAGTAGGPPPNIAANYPGIPSISGGVYYNALRLVQAGKRMGNRIDVFSKIGDSITANPIFLDPIGTGGLRLGGYANLQPVVDFFSRTIARTNNSFANESLAAHGAWTTVDALNPGSANSTVCSPGETPLDCELRITKPSVALIMFGTNDMAIVPPEQFRANLNTIIRITEAHGVIPVLSTTLGRKDSPDLAPRTDRYNAVIIQVAQANGVPLWNYWLSCSGLANGGLSTDNVHPSLPYDGNSAIFDGDHLSAGINVRNLTALQVLDALYRTVLH